MPAAIASSSHKTAVGGASRSGRPPGHRAPALGVNYRRAGIDRVVGRSVRKTLRRPTTCAGRGFVLAAAR